MAEVRKKTGLPDFVLLFNQIGHYLKNPQRCSPADLKVAKDAFVTIIMTIYPEASVNACHFDPPTIKPLL